VGAASLRPYSRAGDPIGPFNLQPSIFNPVTFERYIHQLRVELPAPGETVVEARARLAEKFPRNVSRRMTHLGLLLGSTLDGIPLGPEDAVVYASTFAETRSLEDFLGGFPAASPLLFQTSIHPGGIQQVMVGRQQPVARLWPLAGNERIVEQAFETALLEPAARVIVTGGEERGTWMLEHQMAAAQPFAFALALGREATGAIGRVRFVPGEVSAGPCPTLEELANALSGRRPLDWLGVGGAWTLAWL
jgi:hypothetical protein